MSVQATWYQYRLLGVNTGYLVLVEATRCQCRLLGVSATRLRPPAAVKTVRSASQL